MKKLITLFILAFLCTSVSKSNSSLPDLDKVIKNDVTNFSIYIGNTKKNKKKPVNESLYQFANLFSYSESTNDPKEININNKKYFAYSGCRHQSCEEKGLIWIDKENKITVGLLVHYFFNDNTYNEKGDFLIFSKNLEDSTKLPEEFYKILKEWNTKATRYDFNTKKHLPINPNKIRFINSKNEVLDITNIFKKNFK